MSDSPTSLAYQAEEPAGSPQSKGSNKQREHLQALIGSIDEVVFEFDDKGTYLNIWTADDTLLARPRQELFGRTINDVLGEAFATPFLEAFERVLRTGQSENIEYSLEVLGGQRWFLARINPIFRPDGSANTVSMLSRDISERRRIEQMLRERNEELRSLSARLAEVEESERRRLAQELHDQVGQRLTAISLNLNVIRSLLPRGAVGQQSDFQRLDGRLQDSLALVEQTVERVRDLMAELRPTILDDYGLAAALRWYCQQFSQRTGIVTTVQAEPLIPRLPAAIETALFRISQEALTNVAKHARASEVSLRLEGMAGLVHLTVIDNGLGFDPHTTQIPNRSSWGLSIMRERAEAVGGSLQIESVPGEGVCMVVTVPG